MTFYAVAAVIPFKNTGENNYRVDFFTINNAHDEIDATKYVLHLPLSIQQWRNIGSVYGLTYLPEKDYRKLRALVGAAETYVPDLETYQAHIQDLRERICEKEHTAEVTKA